MPQALTYSQRLRRDVQCMTRARHAAASSLLKLGMAGALSDMDEQRAMTALSEIADALALLKIIVAHMETS